MIYIILFILNISMLCLNRNNKVKFFGKIFNRIFLGLLILSLILLGSYDYENCNFLMVIIGFLYPIYRSGEEIKVLYIRENIEDLNI